ncbi:MAG: NAD(P)H-dependent oxidoreductase [Actinomycetota bacterium]|nr:NAD(P)H-dependent oxidoreductase [Actinomycetota bacterium]
MRGSDAATLTTAAYHETLAGATKNALDFAQFLSRDQKPYFDGKVVGLVATAGEEIAGANATGWPYAGVGARGRKRGYNRRGVGGRLKNLGRLVVGLASRLVPEGEGAGQMLRASA